MSENIEGFYQQIGQLAVDSAGGIQDNLLVYAEVEEGAVSVDLFFLSSADKIQFRAAPSELYYLVYKFWQQWKEQPNCVEWFSMSYVLKSGKFSIEFKYPGQVDMDEDVTERRKIEVKAQLAIGRSTIRNGRVAASDL